MRSTQRNVAVHGDYLFGLPRRVLTLLDNRLALNPLFMVFKHSPRVLPCVVLAVAHDAVCQLTCNLLRLQKERGLFFPEEALGSAGSRTGVAVASYLTSSWQYYAYQRSPLDKPPARSSSELNA